MKEQTTQLQQQLKIQIKEIYENIIRFGFPGLVASKVTQQPEEMEKELSDYLQPTPKREHLIEWLILTLNPLYSQEMHNKTNKKRNIMNNLWKLGVMPFSKHTANLDYEKYIEGLLGYENSVKLIHNLCCLLKQSLHYQKSKEDHKFNSFMEQLMDNYDNLVNLDYDPYKVSFPAAYQHLSDQQFQAQYQQTIDHLSKLSNQLQLNQLVQTQSNVQGIFNEFQQNKSKFQELYSQLVQKTKEVVEKHKEMIDNWTPPPTVEERTLKISPNLPKIYRLYKNKIALTQIPHHKLREQTSHIRTLIENINETTCL